MSIKRDINGYKVFELKNGEQLLWAEEDRVLYSRNGEDSLVLSTEPDDEFEKMLEALELVINDRDQLRKELEEAQEPTSKTLERILLEMWHSQGIKEIYKYKHRIKIYRREGLDGYDLFNDITCGLLFTEVEDTANYRDATPEDFRVSVEFLLNKEERENQDEHI